MADGSMGPRWAAWLVPCLVLSGCFGPSPLCDSLDGQQGGLEVRRMEVWVEGSVLVASVEFEYLPKGGVPTDFGGYFTVGLGVLPRSGDHFRPERAYSYRLEIGDGPTEEPYRFVDERALADPKNGSMARHRMDGPELLPLQGFTREFVFPLGTEFRAREGAYSLAYTANGGAGQLERIWFLFSPCFNLDTQPFYGLHPDGKAWCAEYNSDGLDWQQAQLHQCKERPDVAKNADFEFAFRMPGQQAHAAVPRIGSNG